MLLGFSVLYSFTMVLDMIQSLLLNFAPCLSPSCWLSYSFPLSAWLYNRQKFFEEKAKEKNKK
ncbi:MAG: hypothetical protein MRERV_39c028 [Mycoplasmataceae bacterium RV_VA103A]|nr:MAG: hypothetical protein MRERV_39c028 [Mycoplasmataceae bacterium RV_VA103A]